MSKFACACGNVISDVDCPNEVAGTILSDKSHEKFFDEVFSLINECLEHASQGKISEWTKKYFDEMYPKDLSLGQMLHDVLHTRYCNLTLAVLECHKCGRLWVERTVGENDYREYVPGTQDHVRVLGLNKRSQDG